LEKKLTSEKGAEHPLTAIQVETKSIADLRLANIEKVAQVSKNIQSSPAQMHSEVILDPLLGKDISWQQLPEVVDILFSKIQVIKDLKDKSHLFCQIESTLKNLAHLKHKDCSLPKDLALRTLSRLTEIQEQYNHGLADIEYRCIPSVRMASMEFLALSYVLAIASDPAGILKDYHVSTEVFENAIYANIYYSLEDPSILEQQSSLLSFFKKRKPFLKENYSIWNSLK